MTKESDVDRPHDGRGPGGVQGRDFLNFGKGGDPRAPERGLSPLPFAGTPDLAHLFTYHAPSPEQLDAYAALRNEAFAFAHILVALTPHGADQAAAIRLLRECVMTANAAIALGGRINQ